MNCNFLMITKSTQLEAAWNLKSVPTNPGVSIALAINGIAEVFAAARDQARSQKMIIQQVIDLRPHEDGWMLLLHRQA